MEEMNLNVKQRDTKTYTLRFYDTDNSTIDISGWVVFFTVKNKVDDVDASAILQKNITSHSNPTSGETKIILSTTDTNLSGNYIYDIQIKKNTGEIITVLEGTIAFTKDVTRRTS